MNAPISIPSCLVSICLMIKHGRLVVRKQSILISKMLISKYRELNSTFNEALLVSTITKKSRQSSSRNKNIRKDFFFQDSVLNNPVI